MSTDKPRAVGYILKRFPVLSETFILNEILALEAKGIPVHIFSLERPNDSRFHEDLPKLKASISYVPDLGSRGDLLKHNRRAARNYRGKYFHALNHTLTRGKPSLLWRFMQACYIANEARRYGISHLHAHFATRPTSVAYLASMISGVPYSFTAHAMDIFKKKVNKKALARKIENADFVVTVSEYNKSYLEDVAHADSDKLVRVYNGIDLNRFSPNGGPARDPFTILSVARLVEKKGTATLIEACRHLRDRGLDFECWLVGKGAQRTKLEAMIKEWKLKDRVKLLGPHSQMEVLERYHQAHLFALPCTEGSDGNKDGLPVALVEAMACGLPVVTTAMTGIPEIVHDGENGLLVPDSDPVALADAIERLMRDEGLYEQLRISSREAVVAQFDVNQTREQLTSLFQREAA